MPSLLTIESLAHMLEVLDYPTLIFGVSIVFTSSPSNLPSADSTLNYQFNPSQKLSNLTIFETSTASAKCSDTNKRALLFHHAVNHGKDNSMKKSRKRLNRSVSQSVKPDNVHANFPYQKIFSQSPTSLIQSIETSEAHFFIS